MNAWDKKFDTEAQKLGVRGVTIIVASGDDGVGGYEARWASSKFARYHISVY
jgi:hypothetical protein